MTKTVLDVGNCSPDHNAIKRMLVTNYNVEVLQADQWSDTQRILATKAVDLILVNRKLDIDYSDGMEILKSLKSGEATRQIPVMLVTNYPEHQQAAVEAGGVYGFGKLELNSPQTHERLGQFLTSR
ncbi:MAG: response regulator [Pirellula sp.]|jgi:two-component system chemotaxis response regulator CheY|nr:response regulator [Pirellula sp.]